MKNRFVTGLVCGIAIGASGLLTAYRIGFQAGAAITQPPAIQPAPLASPQMPPGSHTYKFNGGDYYVVPLSEMAKNCTPATH
jgi:hypothetical protein